ncbi:MAG TPA: uracil-DNA glycosylase family protein [Flavitalea sp.]|nr:uracil-DNA glycosylase family protein [Flavitalea sp.]
MTFGQKVIRFNKSLHYSGKPLPAGIRIMNPFRESESTMQAVESFYNKFYNDHQPRHLVLGINPGRFGGGLTGIPFTDPKRLTGECDIPYKGKMAHEPSSVFVYKMINAYGGAAVFYKDFFINSPSPLGFTSIRNNKEINYNYYDSIQLMDAVKGFMIESIKSLIALGIITDHCICLGTGKNEKFLNRLNDEFHFFGKITALEHPRYIMQYKNKSMDAYIEKYISLLHAVNKG